MLSMGPLHAARAAPEQVSQDAGQGLRSARLRLRRFTPDDLPLLVELNADERVMRHLGGVQTQEQTRALLDSRVLAYYEANPGLGIWATTLRGSGACIGFHMLNNIQGESLIQIGYRLFPQYWGQGYATEMSVGLLRYGYAQLGLSSLSAIAEPANDASRQVLLKSGLHECGERSFPHPAYAKVPAFVYFERAARDWLNEHPGTES